jgi:hypothetical protein
MAEVKIDQNIEIPQPGVSSLGRACSNAEPAAPADSQPTAQPEVQPTVAEAAAPAET